MMKSATLSACGRYRYELERWWAVGGLCVLFVMLNPSTGDADVGDPTIARCIAFAKAWGFNGMRIVNLCTFRTPSPKEMYDFMQVEQSRQQRQRDLVKLASAAGKQDVGIVVCAWGKVRPAMKEHEMQAFVALRRRRITYAIKLNNDGSPAHPLYQRGDSQYIRYEGPQ